MRVNKKRFRTEDGSGMALAFGQQGGCLRFRLQQERECFHIAVALVDSHLHESIFESALAP